MKTAQMILSLAALLFAMPAMAQSDVMPPQKKPIRLTIDADADFAIALVAANDRALPVFGKWVLSDALVVILLKEDSGKFSLDLEQVDNPTLSHWQAATFDAKKGLSIHAIQKIDADYAAPPKLDADAMPDATASDSDAQRPKPALVPATPPIALKVEQAGKQCKLHATFQAPTDDYRLVLVRVDETDDGIADVYLYRKLPGKGEGMHDVIETHSVAVAMACGGAVRVFLAEGTNSRPGEATAWKLLAKLPK